LRLFKLQIELLFKFRNLSKADMSKQELEDFNEQELIWLQRRYVTEAEAIGRHRKISLKILSPTMGWFNYVKGSLLGYLIKRKGELEIYLSPRMLKNMETGDRKKMLASILAVEKAREEMTIRYQRYVGKIRENLVVRILEIIPGGKITAGIAEHSTRVIASKFLPIKSWVKSMREDGRISAEVVAMLIQLDMRKLVEVMLERSSVSKAYRVLKQCERFRREAGQEKDYGYEIILALSYLPGKKQVVQIKLGGEIKEIYVLRLFLQDRVMLSVLEDICPTIIVSKEIRARGNRGNRYYGINSSV